MSFKYVEGDLIEMAKNGQFDVIAHGCNCFCTMKSGIAPQMAKAFGCDKFSLERKHAEGDIDKLGNIEYEKRNVDTLRFKAPPKMIGFEYGKDFYVVNAYTQFHYGYEPGKTYLDYAALELCLKKINAAFGGMHIGLPMIGAGKAQGDWKTIETMIKTHLYDCDVTIVKYKK